MSFIAIALYRCSFLFALFFLSSTCFLASLTLNFFKLTVAKFRGKVCQLGFSLKFYENNFANRLFAMLLLELQKKDEITSLRFFVHQIRFFSVVNILFTVFQSFLLAFFKYTFLLLNFLNQGNVPFEENGQNWLESRLVISLTIRFCKIYGLK